MSTTTYRPAPAVASIAADLITRHHPHLVDAPIVYLFRDPARRARGRVVIGSARRVTGLSAYLAALAAGDVPEDETEAAERDYSFFVMEVAADEWGQATGAQRAALVDHELCHMAFDAEAGELSLRGHDLEEFDAVVRRHGVWREDVAAFIGACSGSSSCVVGT